MKTGRILKKCFREKGLGIVIVLCTLTLFFSCFFTDSMQENKRYIRRTIYGFHNGAAFDITQTAENRFIDHLSIQSYGEMNISGTILSDDGTAAFGYIGSVDDNFKQMEQLRFREGSYPQNEHEIAIEFALMDLLHIPYQIGSPVTLHILHEDGTSETKEYVLCGILESYTTNWKSNGYPLCGAFTYSSSSVEQKHLFFIGDYPDSNAMQELNDLLDAKESDVLFNDYAYQGTFSEEDIAEEGGLIIGMIAFSVLFIICVEISTYRKVQYRMRVLRALGMDRKTLRSRQYRETVKQWLLITLCSIIASTCISLILVFFFDHLLKFRLTVLPYIVSIVVPFPIVLFAKTIQLSILFKTGINDDKRIANHQQEKMRRITGDVLNQKSLLRVVHKRNSKFYVLQGVIVLLSSLVLFTCLYSIGIDVKYYRYQVSEMPADYSWINTFPNSGLGKEEIKEIKDCWGIEEVIYCSSVSNVFFRYEGYKNSTYAFEYNYKSYNPNGISISVISLPDESLIYDDFSQYIQDPVAFHEGKVVLCSLSSITQITQPDGTPGIVFWGEGSRDVISQEAVYSPDVQNGSHVQLCYDEKEYDTTVQMIPEVNNTKYALVNNGLSFSNCILVSESFYDQVFENDNHLYNHVFAYGNDSLAYETTDKIMSAVTTNQAIQFQNDRLRKEEQKNQMINHCTLLGVIAVLVSISAFVIIYRSRIHFFEREQNRISLFRNLGTDSSLLRKLYCTNHIYILIPAIICTVTVLLIVFFVFKYQPVLNFSSILDLVVLSIHAGLDEFPILLFLAAYLLYCIILLVIFKITMHE